MHVAELLVQAIKSVTNFEHRRKALFAVPSSRLCKESKLTASKFPFSLDNNQSRMGKNFVQSVS